MAKFTLLLATFTVFLILTNASIYRLQEDFDQYDDENPTEQQQTCREEFFKHNRLRACQRFLKKQTMLSPRQLEAEEEEEQGYYLQPFRHVLFQRCCEELRSSDARCRCPMLKRAMKIQQEKGQLRFEETRKMYSTARNIPNMCKLEPMSPCPFQKRRSLE